MSDTFLGEQIEAVNRAVLTANCEFYVDDDPVTSLDPEGDAIIAIQDFISVTQAALEDLQDRLDQEVRIRETFLDEMEEDEFDAWQEKLGKAHADRWSALV